VAGRIAYTQENEAIVFLGQLNGLFIPWLPSYGIRLVSAYLPKYQNQPNQNLEW